MSLSFLNGKLIQFFKSEEIVWKKRDSGIKVATSCKESTSEVSNECSMSMRCLVILYFHSVFDIMCNA